MILQANDRIGKYELLRKLGRGGMGDVYLARDTTTDLKVAVKLIEHGADIDTREAIEAERHGVQLQSRLSEIDPRVVRILETGDLDGYFYIAMEYVDGTDLSESLCKRIPTAEAIRIAIAVAETLDNAHNLRMVIGGRELRGIIHGDIKPKNIRIEPGGHHNIK